MAVAKNIVSLTPHIGIGDLIIVKMTTLTNGLHIKQININDELVRAYTSDYPKKMLFLKQFIQWLFPSSVCVINDSPTNFIQFRRMFPLMQHYLYDSVDRSLIKRDDRYKGCIAFHTKLRYDGFIDRFKAEYADKLILLFKKFKTDKPIILIGERTIGKNIETELHKTISLYDILLNLNENNTVIDLTKEILTEGGDFDEFLEDIAIINNSACNVTFGVGGPLSLTSAFSKNNIAFIPCLDSIPYLQICKQIHNNICQNIEDFDSELSLY